MLLPSALPCEPRPPLRRFDQYIVHQRSSQTLSADHPSQFASGITSTCRALHSLLGVQPPSSQVNRQSRRITTTTTAPSLAGSRVKKHKAPVPCHRGVKRCRNTFEADEEAPPNDDKDRKNHPEAQLSTPKRQRRIPTNIPFGLEPSDFYGLESQPRIQSSSPQLSQLSLCSGRTPRAKNQQGIMEQSLGDQDDEDQWSDDDDRMLVDMVLDKLKLSRREWDECARALGADQKSLGKRWKYLLNEGQVGLKFRRGGWKPYRGDVRDVW